MNVSESDVAELRLAGSRWVGKICWGEWVGVVVSGVVVFES